MPEKLLPNSRVVNSTSPPRNDQSWPSRRRLSQAALVVHAMAQEGLAEARPRRLWISCRGGVCWSQSSPSFSPDKSESRAERTIKDFRKPCVVTSFTSSTSRRQAGGFREVLILAELTAWQTRLKLC